MVTKKIYKYINKNPMYAIFMVIPIIIIMVVSINLSKGLSDENIVWSSGNTYKLTPGDNLATENEYTIKAIDFPAPVRGRKAVNGSIFTERPINPVVIFELYKDIINNTQPIDKFSLGIGDEYITADKETRISIDSIPDSNSQDWVYEYYNPWANIKIQNRATPNLDIQFSLTDSFGSTIDEDDIKPGDNIKIEVKIKNTGEDIMKNMGMNIDPDPLLLQNVLQKNELKPSLYELNKNEEKDFDIYMIIPVDLEDRVYGINVTCTGEDVNNKTYIFNATRMINVKSDIGSIYIEKQISQNTTYLKEYEHVTLNVINEGHLVMDNIRLHDVITDKDDRDKLIYIKDGAIINDTDIYINKNSIGPSESWTIGYNLKPTEPGIYVLPKFDLNFSIKGRELSASSGEVGFRVFGPKIILNKSIVDRGNGSLDVSVRIKNIGNGFAKVEIRDQLPEGGSSTSIISGERNLTTHLDPYTEKFMNYTIKVDTINIKNLTWPPARANYYLDDWKFNTSSDENFTEGYKIEEGHDIEAGIRAHLISVMSGSAVGAATEQTGPTGNDKNAESKYSNVTLPKINETQKKVVATIPVVTPKIPTNSIPGFESWVLILILILSVILRRNKQKF